MPNYIRAGHFRSRHYFNENQSPLRRVDTYELELLEQGNGFSVLDGEQYAHLPQRLILARPGTQRFSVGSFSCQFVHFSAQSPREEALLNQLSFSCVADVSPVKLLMEDLFRMREQPDEEVYFARQAALCSLLKEAASLLGHEASSASESDPHLSAILDAKAYLDIHFGEKISLDMLAEHAHLSRNFFRSRFAKIMGLSPRAYLSQVRISYAKQLLRASSLPLSQISEACGYESQAYFNFVFKQETGQTPLRYRKEKQQHP